MLEEPSRSGLGVTLATRLSMGFYPAICDEPDPTIKANNLLWIREDTRHIAGLPFSSGLQMHWTDWNLFAGPKEAPMTDNRREQLENMIGGIRMIDFFDFEQIVYWGF